MFPFAVWEVFTLFSPLLPISECMDWGILHSRTFYHALSLQKYSPPLTFPPILLVKSFFKTSKLLFFPPQVMQCGVTLCINILSLSLNKDFQSCKQSNSMDANVDQCVGPTRRWITIKHGNILVDIITFSSCAAVKSFFLF